MEFFIQNNLTITMYNKQMISHKIKLIKCLRNCGIYGIYSVGGGSECKSSINTKLMI
jgi:hypothetical protein